jgi:hypothetical protein
MPRGRPDYDVWSAPVRPTPSKGLSVYTFEFTIPANTPQTTPASQDLTLEEGIVTRVNIVIPPGHATLAGMAIFSDNTQVLPQSGWLKGNNDNLIFDVDIPIPGTGTPAVYKLTAKGYNTDDTYPHTFYIRIWVMKGVS